MVYCVFIDGLVLKQTNVMLKKTNVMLKHTNVMLKHTKAMDTRSMLKCSSASLYFVLAHLASCNILLRETQASRWREEQETKSREDGIFGMI